MSENNFEKIKKEFEEAQKIYYQEIEKSYNEPSFELFQRANKKAWDKFKTIKNTYDEMREPTFSPITFGTKMKLEEFVDCVKQGFFNDFDGSGNYATENEMTDIEINPSDILDNLYLKKYSHVVWFNK